MKMKKMKKSVLTLLLSILMMLQMIVGTTVPVFADAGSDPAIVQETEAAIDEAASITAPETAVTASADPTAFDLGATDSADTVSAGEGVATGETDAEASANGGADAAATAAETAPAAAETTVTDEAAAIVGDLEDSPAATDDSQMQENADHETAAEPAAEDTVDADAQTASAAESGVTTVRARRSAGVAAKNAETQSNGEKEGNTDADKKDEGDGDEDEAESSNVSHNLADHIISLQVIGDPEKVTAGSNLTVKFGWLIHGEIHGGTDVFTYQLPVNFGISEAATGPITKGEDGPQIGTYLVDTSGMVTITYNSDYNTDNQTTVNYMQIAGEAKYGDDTGGHQIKFTWEDKSTVIWVEKAGDFTVEKEAVKTYANGTLGNNSTVAYTVTISSENGTNGEFTISDVLTKEGFGESDSIAYNVSSFKLIDNTGKTIAITPTIDNEAGSFTIENVPALHENSSYTLTYEINVNHAVNTGAKLTNNVSVSDGAEIKTDKTTTSYSKILDKSFSGYNNQNGYMSWKVTINTNGQDLTGFTFRDVADAELIPGSFRLQAETTGNTYVQHTTTESFFKIDTEGDAKA